MEEQTYKLIMDLYKIEENFKRFVNQLWDKWSIIKYTKWHNQHDFNFFDSYFVDKVNDLSEKYQSFINELTSTSDISPDYERFIMMEIGQQSLDPQVSMNNDVESSISLLFTHMKEKEENIWSSDFDQNIWIVENFSASMTAYFDFYSSKLSSLIIFSNISQVSGNTVIIGANGSGKSTFARQLKRLHSENITIISAQHLLLYEKTEQLKLSTNPLDNIRNFQTFDKLPNAKDTSTYNIRREITEDFDNLVNALITDLSIKANEQFINGKENKASLLQTIQLWNTIIEHRELFIDTFWIKVRDKESKEEYEFNQLSDGEKAIFYYIAHILISKEGNYIVVDEPENHLNLAVCNLLWDRLEEVRKDCTFVYLTHNVDFAISRINSTILWNKSFSVPDSWDIQEIPSNTYIPDELLVEIAGSRKNVLFCEGDKGSLDYKLYSILFSDYFTVLPVQGHLDVVNYCGAYNRANLFNGKAIGIVDGDFHSNEQIESWQKKGIFALPYAEIENLLCCQMILDHLMAFHFFEVENINEFKRAAFDYLADNVDSMGAIFVRDTINNTMKNNMLKSKSGIDKLKKEFVEKTSEIKVDEMYDSIRNELLSISSTMNYEGLLKKWNVKRKLIYDFAPKKLRVSDYPDKVLLQLREEQELRLSFINEYFPLILES